jgi:exopolysaccharide biosynthesis WecB/TagA/CpsF family protein
MKHALPIAPILGIPVVRATEADALIEIERLAVEAAPALLVYVNAHTLELSARDADLRRLLREDAALVMNDGVGVSIAAKMMGKENFPAKIFQLAAAKGWRVYLFGAAPGVAEKAAARFLATIPNLVIAGTRSGFFSTEDEPSIIQQIREAATDLLVVGMGNPKQEKWLARHLASTGAKIGIGVGAFLDFSAGVFPRAPLWVQKVKLEWLFRMSREPRRLWKRYLLGGPVFLARVAWSRLMGEK